MTETELRRHHARPQGEPAGDGIASPANFDPIRAGKGTTRTSAGRPFGLILRILVTMLGVGLAALLTWRMWDIYMDAPWTRDATVRAYVVTMAPEVAGQILGLPVVDNQYVRKGDLLIEIDPTNYRIAVSQAEATVQQIEANVQSIEAQIEVQRAQIAASQAQVDQAEATLVYGQQQAAPYQDLAQKGAGTIQNAQLWSSQQRQQEAALRSGQASLELAQRQSGGVERATP